MPKSRKRNPRMYSQQQLPGLQYNERKLARLITQYRDIFFPIFRNAWPSFFRVLQRMTKVFNVTSLKYGKYDITNEKINNNKRLVRLFICYILQMKSRTSRLLLFIFSFVISYLQEKQ